MSMNERKQLIFNKIEEIEDSIEINDGHSNPNRIPARNYIIFALAGGDEDAQMILKHKVYNLLRNPDACAFINIDKNDASENTYPDLIEKIIEDASNNHVDVQDLFTIYLCPVISAVDADQQKLELFFSSVNDYMRKSGRSPIWQPFLLIKRSTQQYENIYSNISFIEHFLTGPGKEISNRCCLLSYQDANGFTVHLEDLLQTVAMTVILQDSISDNQGSIEGVISRVRIASNNVDADKLFFTTRNSSISNPRRSIILQRMISAMEFFSGKTDPNTSDALRRMNFKFLNEIIKPYLDQLPHRDQKISFFPLYATMSGDDFHMRLEQVLAKYYSNPLNSKEAVSAQLNKAVDAFLYNFFLNNGSLQNLKEILVGGSIKDLFESHSMELSNFIPMEDIDLHNKKLDFLAVGEYAAAKQYCEKEINDASRKLMLKLASSLENSDLVSVISDIQEGLDTVIDVVNERLRKLKDAESVLVIDQNNKSKDLSDVQSDWFINQAASNFEQYEKYNKAFDKAILDLLKADTDDYDVILDICYDAVKGSAESNYEFLKKVSDECSRDDSKAFDFINTIKRNWGYTLRFASYDESRDVTCVIGDPLNYLSRSIKDKFNATQFGFSGFDRIDVMRISAPFAPEEIWEWQQIQSSMSEVK